MSTLSTTPLVSGQKASQAHVLHIPYFVRSSLGLPRHVVVLYFVGEGGGGGGPEPWHSHLHPRLTAAPCPLLVLALTGSSLREMSGYDVHGIRMFATIVRRLQLCGLEGIKTLT